MKDKEIKAAYFAQYWGQNVLQFKDSECKPQKVGVTYLTKYGVNHRHLVLKPLSSITDEDAIEVAKLNRSTDPLNLPGVGSVREIAYAKNNIPFLIEMRCIADFLRSKGYALPFRNYSVEQLIEMGWLKLKD